MTSISSRSCTAQTDPPAQYEAPFIHIAQQGGVFRIELNRPEARNPLSMDMINALSMALTQAEQAAEVRVILFTAAGKAFSAGGDLKNIAERLAVQVDADGKDPIATNNRRYGEFLTRLTQTPKITVACIHGAAMGGGAGLACAVDIAIGSPSARFGFPEVGIGLVPGQILPFVSARLGAQLVRRLMLTGERIDAEEAYRIGLLDYLAASNETLPQLTKDVLARIIAGAPVASAATKRLLAATRALAGQPIERFTHYLDQASVIFAQQMRTEAVEGVAAAQANRPACWNIGADLPGFKAD